VRKTQMDSDFRAAYRLHRNMDEETRKLAMQPGLSGEVANMWQAIYDQREIESVIQSEPW
jgi:hypothetical protein